MSRVTEDSLLSDRTAGHVNQAPRSPAVEPTHKLLRTLLVPPPKIASSCAQQCELEGCHDFASDTVRSHRVINWRPAACRGAATCLGAVRPIRKCRRVRRIHHPLL